jgi:hypothetical protein
MDLRKRERRRPLNSLTRVAAGGLTGFGCTCVFTCGLREATSTCNEHVIRSQGQTRGHVVADLSLKRRKAIASGAGLGEITPKKTFAVL